MRSLVSWILRIVVTVVVLVLLARQVDGAAMVEVLASAHPGYIALGLAVALAGRLLMVAKWILLLRAQLPDASVTAAAKIYLASGLAIFLLPVQAGADVARAMAFGRLQGATAKVSASVVAERILGFVALGLACSVALYLGSEAGLVRMRPVALATLGVALAFLAGPFVLFRVARPAASRSGPRWLSFVRRTLEAYVSYRNHLGVLTAAAVGSLLLLGLPVVTLWLLGRALGLGVTVGMLAIAVPFTLLGTRLPISYAGLGIAEVTLVYILGQLGMPTTEAAALALAGRVVDVASVAGPGLAFWHHLFTPRVDR